MRNIIQLECSDCKNRNYTATKNKAAEKLKVKKFCKTCRKHTEHKETK